MRRDDTEQLAEVIAISAWEDGSLKIVVDGDQVVLPVDLDDDERKEFKRWKRKYVRL